VFSFTLQPLAGKKSRFFLKKRSLPGGLFGWISAKASITGWVMANAHQRQRIGLDNDPAVNNRFERIRTRPVAILALAKAQ